MKQSIILSLSFYLYMTIYFIGNSITIEAFCSHVRTQSSQLEDKTLSDIYTTLRIIKQIHQDTESQYDQLSEDDQNIQQDFIVDIMVVLVGTYEKIIGSTVTYYLTMNMPIQQDLQSKVAIIIAEDIVKILNIIGKQLIFFIFNHHMTWQQKIWYCTWTLSIIIMIKLGIDQIPKIIKSDLSTSNVLPENDILNKNIEDKTSYLKDKFSNWK